MTNSATFRINPPLGACILWGLKVMFWVTATFTVFGIISRYLKNQSQPNSWMKLFDTDIAVIFGIGMTLGLFIFSICRIWGTTFKEGALKATTFGGRMIQVPLNSVTGVQAGSVQGLPVLIVKSDAAKSDLYIYTLGVDKSLVHAKLVSIAGPDHLLTRAFS
jgi:hypothetical protein